MLTVDPPTYQSGEPFVVAGVEVTLTDVVPGAGDVFTLGINEKQSVFGTIENLIAGLNSIDKSSPGAGRVR